MVANHPPDSPMIKNNAIIKAVKIYDVSRKQVLEYRNKLIYDISKLTSGFCFISIENSNGFITKNL